MLLIPGSMIISVTTGYIGQSGPPKYPISLRDPSGSFNEGLPEFHAQDPSEILKSAHRELKFGLQSETSVPMLQ